MYTLISCYETHPYGFKDEKMEQVELTFRRDLERIYSGNKCLSRHTSTHAPNVCQSRHCTSRH